MRALEKHGLTPLESAEPVVNHRPLEGPSQAFFEEAERSLVELSPTVFEAVIPQLTELDGRWHPSGFMVFPLGLHPVIGTCRLHIWPRGLRQAEERPSGLVRDIHDHVMHITSLVLTGEYRDAFYDVQRCVSTGVHDRGPNEGREPYRIFAPPAGVPAARSLEWTGDHALAWPVRERSVVAGRIHTISSGEFHAPSIPLDSCTATLVYSSGRVAQQGPHILVGGHEPLIAGTALAVDASQADQVRADLLLRGSPEGPVTGDCR